VWLFWRVPDDFEVVLGVGSLEVDVSGGCE